MSSPTALPENVLAPIEAYDIFAPAYRAYSETKRAYLRKVEEIVIGRIGDLPSRGSLLDVGAGDGSRALRIARCAGVGRVVLLEPSAGMRAQCPRDAEIWPVSIAEISAAAPCFEVIACLWNVIGHLANHGERQLMLARIAKLLAPGGAIFLDVSHRYNAAAYGWGRTWLRIVRDFFSPSETHGDVVVAWKIGASAVHTRGHLFTHAEITELCRSAGLTIARRWAIHYETGESCRCSLSGHLLYQLTSA